MKKQLYSFLLFAFFVTLFLINSALAADINSVFTDVNTKADSILTWVSNYLVYFIALVAFIAWCVAMLFKKMTYVEGIMILIIIILIGFAPTIVGFLMNKQ